MRLRIGGLWARFVLTAQWVQKLKVSQMYVFCTWAALEGKRLGYAGRAICFPLCVNGNWGEILQLLGGVIKSQQTLTWTNFGSENWENLSNYFTLISFQLVCKLAEQNQLNEEEMQKGVDWTPWHNDNLMTGRIGWMMMYTYTILSMAWFSKGSYGVC